jgi:pimeloyl-ACP methyl ester carboxylesterase
MIARLLPFIDCRAVPMRRIAIAVAIVAATASANPGWAQAPAAQVRVDPVVTQMDHISVTTAGKGPAVILIPGLSSPREVWDGTWQALVRDHRVYLVQVNGFGGEDPRGNLQPGILDGIVADLHHLIAREKIERPALVGHSMGGLVALMLAKAYPGDVGKALIVDALPFVGSAFFPGSTVESVKPQAEAMRAQMAGLYGQPFPEAVGQAIARQNALKPESQAKVAAWSAKADMRVTAQALFEDLQTDLRPQLGDIAAPVTVLVPWTAARGGEALVLDLYKREYAGTPHVTVKGVAESGHFIMLDQPEAFRAILAAWLAD